MSSVGAPDIHRSFPSSYAELAVALLLIPGVIGLVCEPPLFLLADRYPRERFIAWGTAIMAAGFVCAALAPSPWVLALALGIAYVANGVAMNLAQAVLVDRNPERRASTLARWSLLGLAGDLGTPLLLVALAGVGLGWRAAFAVMAGLLAAVALGLARVPRTPPPRDPGEAAPTLLGAFATALRHRKLVVWLFGTTLCDLLDEILVVLASLHLRHDLGVGHAWTGIIIAAYALGGAAGLVVVERLALRIGSARLLAGSAALCAVAFLVWLAAPNALASAALMLLVGATAAPLYPLACTQAYAALPGHSGAVLAAGHLFTPLSLALPWLLGFAADRFGVVAALVLLVIEPVGLGLLALIAPVEQDKTPASSETGVE